MNWRSLFTPVKNITAQEVENYINDNPSDSYQLLDVRQPKEYNISHLPGSLLIPLKEVPGRLSELDNEKPLIVYCAIGGRSAAAAQFLSGKNFKQVFNMQGGIKDWTAKTADGEEAISLACFTGDENYQNAAALAYAMEDGLQEFYLRMAKETDSEEEKGLFQKLASFENLHKKRLLEEFHKTQGETAELNQTLPPQMEGGQKIETFLNQVKPLMTSPEKIIEMAMALETQALDLYSRMAPKSSQEETKQFFLSMADEEKTHLSFLALELDKLI